MKMKFLKTHEQYNIEHIKSLNKEVETKVDENLETVAINKDEIQIKRDEISQKISDIESKLDFINSDKIDDKIKESEELVANTETDNQTDNIAETDNEEFSVPELEAQLENFKKELTKLDKLI